MSKAYDDYLKSPHWQLQRAQAMARASSRCQVCDSPERCEVHHRTYERLGHEDPYDLTVLCGSCHSLFHDRLARHRRQVIKSVSAILREQGYLPSIEVPR